MEYGSERRASEDLAAKLGRRDVLVSALMVRGKLVKMGSGARRPRKNDDGKAKLGQKACRLHLLTQVALPGIILGGST